MGATRHGESDARTGKLFPGLDPCAPSDAAIAALVAWMGDVEANPPVANPHIPAGFTYLSQFVDHDLTFDPAPLRRPGDPVNLRTPRLDLDSVYGAGPDAQPFLYDWAGDPPGARMLVGAGAVEDLPRNKQGRALIGDPRNDENLIVAQLHLLFLRFHNAIVERLAGSVPDAELFDRARTLVRRHYQWIVLRELLPLVAGEAVAAEALVARRHFSPEPEPFVPLEFSGGAFRYGHSMVRPGYGLRALPPGVFGQQALSIFPDLEGLRPLEANRVIDWERFFPLGEGQSAEGVQRSMLLDTSIAAPLFALPDGGPPLPERNLRRARKLGVPSGQAVAEAMRLPPLADERLHLDALPPAVADELRAAMPLWFYVLCEGGLHLGPVGGRIVAEVLAGLVAADPRSYLSEEPDWRPVELGTGGRFGMADLIRLSGERPGG
jgi:hypothetical protein